MVPFSPCYIFESELERYGLPTTADVPDIMNTIQLASALVDTECGRVDGDGNGSLVFTTYTQRILLATRNRNLVMVNAKPIVGLDAGLLAELAASGAVQAASGLAGYNSASGENFFDTGALQNTILRATGQLSGIVACSGRYGYTRMDSSIAYPDLFAQINPLNLLTMFGGPAPWVPVDVGNIDYDNKTGECWIPAGLQLQKYAEILITYNAGYDPRYMPRTIKQITAALVKNALAKGDGTTGLINMQVGGGSANYSMQAKLLDPTLDAMLQPYRTVRAA